MCVCGPRGSVQCIAAGLVFSFGGLMVDGVHLWLAGIVVFRSCVLAHPKGWRRRYSVVFLFWG